MDADVLRALVRQVLVDVLPEGVVGRSVPPSDGPTAAPEAPPGPAPDTAPEPVQLRTDADLDDFVRRLLRMYENPKHRDDLRSGRLRFTLGAGSATGRPVPTRLIDKGAVTEAHVKDAARAGAALVLGRRAVLTPLARDRARALGVVVEKES